MNDRSVGGVHWSFWIISAIALIWNVMGSINFLLQLNADAVASFPATHRAIIEGRPVWATAGFATAVFGGTLGCLLLLFRKSAAFYFFVASLLGVFVTMIHTLRIATATGNFSLFEIVMMILLPVVVAALLIWYTKQAERQGWIR